MKLFSVKSVLGTLAGAAVLFISISGSNAQADALSAKITNKVLSEHNANMRAGIVPRQQVSNKVIDNRVEGAKTVASALTTGAPILSQHPSDEVQPARGPKNGHFVPKKK